MADIKTVGVVGAGTMGSGIAHVFARAGFKVLLCDVEQRFLDRALAQIRTNWAARPPRASCLKPRSSRHSRASLRRLIARRWPPLNWWLRRRRSGSK